MGGGGTTTTSGIIPPELQGLYRGSSQRLLDQQSENPLGTYNAANPTQTAGSDPLQQYGASLIGGGAQPTGLDALTLQGILRGTGLAGAGPTTGTYDYGSEAGLGDLMSFLEPYRLNSPGLTAPHSLGSAGFENQAPNSTQPANDYSGLASALAPRSAGAPGGAPGGASSPGSLQELMATLKQGGAAALPASVNSPFGPHYAPGGGSAGSGAKNPNAIDWGTDAPYTGTFQRDENGMPIGPGGFKYTGAQHEFSGGVGKANVDKINAATAAGGPSYAQFMDEVTKATNQKALQAGADSAARGAQMGTQGVNFNDPASWRAAQARAAAAGPKQTGADRKKP